MVDTCVIRRVTGQATDPETGVVTPTVAQVYTGKCKIQESSGFAGSGRVPDAGEHTYTLLAYVLHLPMSATAPGEGDLVEITASVLDPALVGREYRIAKEFAKTFATARRLEVEETTS